MKKFERTLCGIIILALICGYFVTTSRADVEVPVPEESTTITAEETTETTYDNEEMQKPEEEIIEDDEEVPDEEEVNEQETQETTTDDADVGKEEDEEETETKSDEEYKYVGKDSTYEYYVSIKNGKLYLANYCKLCGYGDINSTTKSEIENRFGVDVDSLFK